MVPELTDLERKNIFSRSEIKKIVEKRRAFEYRLISNPSKHDYLKYVEYETALEQLRRRRRNELGWKKRSLSDQTGIKQIINIYERAIAGKFKGDVKLWFQYIDFCLESGSSKHLQKVIIKALRIHPMEERFWILAADRELRLGHLKAARTMLMRAMRFKPKSTRLWEQYFKLECLIVHHVQKKSGSKPTNSASATGDINIAGLVDEKIEAQLPPAPKEEKAEQQNEQEETIPGLPKLKDDTGSSDEDGKKLMAVILIVLRQASMRLKEDDSVSEFLRFAWSLVRDVKGMKTDTTQADQWAHVLGMIELLVENTLESQRVRAWTLWWELTGPRDARAQADVVLSKASDEVVENWINACSSLEEIVDHLAAHEKIRRNPRAVAALPLVTEAAKECLRSCARASSCFALKIRLWSLDRPTTKEMFSAVSSATVEPASASVFIKALPAESRVDGFLRIAFLLDANRCRPLIVQLLAFQLALGMEAYQTCIERITKDIRTDARYLKYGDHKLAILDTVLLTNARLGIPNLEPLFDQACDMEKHPSRLVDLWARYEHYVAQQGGDAAKIRWRASRGCVQPQEIIERLKELE